MIKFLPFAAAGLAAVAGANVARASGSEAEPAAGEPHFVPLDEIKVPIIGSTRIEGRLRVKLVLDAKDAAAADELAERIPQLRATALAATIEFSRLYASGIAPVNAELLRSELTGAVTHEHKNVARILVVEVAAERA